MRSFSAKLGAAFALGAAVSLMLACGSSSADFYDAPSMRSPVGSGAGVPGSTGGGGASPAGGAPSVGASGSSSLAGGGQSAGNAGSAGSAGNTPCSPAHDVSGGMSGVLGTTGAACLRVTGAITGWGCSNFDGRTLKVNGRTVMCAELPLPDEIDGAYYFDISQGTFDYASLYWF